MSAAERLVSCRRESPRAQGVTDNQQSAGAGWLDSARQLGRRGQRGQLGQMDRGADRPPPPPQVATTHQIYVLTLQRLVFFGPNCLNFSHCIELIRIGSALHLKRFCISYREVSLYIDSVSL